MRVSRPIHFQALLDAHPIFGSKRRPSKEETGSTSLAGEAVVPILTGSTFDSAASQAIPTTSHDLPEIDSGQPFELELLEDEDLLGVEPLSSTTSAETPEVSTHDILARRRLSLIPFFSIKTAAIQEKEGRFRFLDLPGELRNAIYYYACELTGLAASRINRGSCLLPPPITKASRAVRQESLPIFFQTNTFHVSVARNYYLHSMRFLRRVESHWHHLRYINICILDLLTHDRKTFLEVRISPDSICVTLACERTIRQEICEHIIYSLRTSRAKRQAATFDGTDLVWLFTDLHNFRWWSRIEDRQRPVQAGCKRYPLPFLEVV